MRHQKRGSSAIFTSSTTHHCESSRCTVYKGSRRACVARRSLDRDAQVSPRLACGGEDTDLEEAGMKVSCMCATYNRPPNSQWLLEEAIESFLRQDYAEKELLVLNDCAGQELVCD